MKPLLYLYCVDSQHTADAIAVLVENGYYGARFAGRIASLMIEKHIKGDITRTDLENWILTHSLENEYKKPYSGEPFKINRETTLQVIENYAIEEKNPIKIEKPSDLKL